MAENIDHPGDDITTAEKENATQETKKELAISRRSFLKNSAVVAGGVMLGAHKIQAAEQVSEVIDPLSTIPNPEVQKSLALDATLPPLETLNDYMGDIPEWLSKAATDDHFFEWIGYLAEEMNDPDLVRILEESRQSQANGDNPMSFQYPARTQEEIEQMWRLYEAWCAPRNTEAKTLEWRQPWVLMLTPQAYEQFQNENVGIEDPIEWLDSSGKPIFDHIKNEFKYIERTMAAAGFNVRCDIIPEFVIIDDPLADEIDQPLPDGKLDNVNERLRDELVRPGLQDPESALSKQIASVAEQYGRQAHQMQVVTVARWGQSAGETNITHSNDEDTGGYARMFGIRSGGIGNFDGRPQSYALFNTEYIKSMMAVSDAGDTPVVSRAWVGSCADIRAEHNIPDDWWPVGVQGQSDEDNKKLFKDIQDPVTGRHIVTVSQNLASSGKLLTMSNPNTTVTTLWQQWDPTGGPIGRGGYIGDTIEVPIVPGEKNSNAVEATNFEHRFVISNMTQEVGLLSREFPVGTNTEVTATEVEGGYQVVVPNSAVLAEGMANPNLTSFRVNKMALPEGIELVAQDDTGVTLMVSDAALTTLPSGALDISVLAYSTENEHISSPETTMRLSLESLLAGPEANSETLDVPYESSISIASLIANDPGATGIEVEGELPSFMTLEGDQIVLDWDYILNNEISTDWFEYRTVDADGTESENTAIATLTFKNEGGFTVDVERVDLPEAHSKIYPNPWDGRSVLTLDVQNPDDDPVTVQVVNMNGQVQTYAVDQHHDGAIPLDGIRSFATTSGTYIVRVTIGEKTFSHKIIRR